MQNAKYYTPDIEEFYVGFEFEHEFKNHPVIKDGWGTDIITGETRLKCIADYIAEKRVRVKHLDREDIESLEWISLDDKEFYLKNHVTGEFVKIRTYFHAEKSLIRIFHGLFDKSEKSTLKLIHKNQIIEIFRGNIRNKSELRKIMKMLNIQTT